MVSVFGKLKLVTRNCNLNKKYLKKKKIIVEINRVLLSLNKDSGTVKGSKMTLRWDYNDSRGAEMS